MKDEIAEEVISFYLGSRHFNGLDASKFKGAKDVAAIKQLIAGGMVDLVRGDSHPNPHIKALPADTIESQLAKIDSGGLRGCLYPTPKFLLERNAGTDETAPYTKALKEGAPQLSHRSFDLRALEFYRNDPRFEFDVDDMNGVIWKKEETLIEDGSLVADRLGFLRFGFAYNSKLHRAFAVFVWDLFKLPKENQVALERFELDDEYKLHPGFFETAILGEFPSRVSIYQALLEEKILVNEICALINKPTLFRTDHRTSKRPRKFGILIRPTKMEYEDFALLLDQLLSDDMNLRFFDNDLISKDFPIDPKGDPLPREKVGSISLLEIWIKKFFRPHDSSDDFLAEIISNLRAVRKARQKPAHRSAEDDFDQKYIADQRLLIDMAFRAVRLLRLVLQNHPKAKSIEIPDYLREARVWLY